MFGEDIHISSYFPWSLLVALLVAILFAALGIFIFRRGMKKADKPPEPKLPSDAEVYWRARFKQILARYGYFPTDAMTRSFLRAQKVLQSFIGGRNFKYQLPWYLMLGAEDSGKTSLLNSLDVNLPVGRPHFDCEEGEGGECDWWFFDHGVILDIDGRLFLEADEIISDEGRWDMLLNLIAHHRPKRPLDGIIMTISSEDLMGEGKLNEDDLRLRAEYMYMKLWQLQRKTGLRLPVYIVVTKCDTIPGYQQFCSALPKERYKDVFGWSNESAIEVSYEPQWVCDAFDAIRVGLYRLQQNIFAEGETYADLEGIFRFPFRFAEMRGNLQSFVNHIFKTSGYHEAYFLRGIYFTGDSAGAGEAPSAEPSLAAQREQDLESLMDLESEVLGEQMGFSHHVKDKVLRHGMYFVDDLFEKRIFREIGLARPVSSVLLGNTSAMRAAKVGVATGTVVATLGLLNAANDLNRAKDNLLPALTQINHTLSLIKGQDPTSDTGRLFFEQQAEILLRTMVQVQVNDMTSFFIPASWFSSVNDDIKDVMASAFDEVILKSMARELNYKATDLVSLSRIVPVREASELGINPLRSEEFLRLRDYVYQVHGLALAAERFNSIGTTANLQDVADIINYLFAIKMPKEFFANDEFYIRALKSTKVRIFDFEQYNSNAIIKLRKLYDEFQLVAFDPEAMILGLGELSKGLKGFADRRNMSTYDSDNLRNISSALSKTINSLSNPEIAWIDVDHFNPGVVYEHVMATIAGSPLLGAEVTSNLTAESGTNFKHFKAQLATYHSNLTNGPVFKHDGAHVLAKPSDGAVKLMGLLNLFYSEKFMHQPIAKNIISQVPQGSVLMWDSLRLEQGTELIKAYNQFVNTRLLTFPRHIQILLHKVASESLVANLTEVISDAEVFATEQAPSAGMSPEDALLPQVQNYRATARDIETILFALRSNKANKPYSDLRSLVTEENYRLLRKLNEILDEDHPYALKDGGFDWWDGKSQAALEAFGVSNVPELKSYLELQRERIRYLAMEFAFPVVHFLKDINKQGMPGNLPLVAKWDNIIDELDGYDKKKKGNGLTDLEKFITAPLNEVTLATCNKYANGTTPITSENVYFVSILNRIENSLNKQCNDLSGYVSASHYSMLADYFDANLAGRFPFNDPFAEGPVVDVDPDELRGFYDLMDERAGDIKATLKQASATMGSAGSRALQFVEDMEDIRKFFGGFLAKGSELPAPQFNFDVEFRVNKQMEKAANQVIDWSLMVEDTKVDFRDKKESAHWNLNEPITISFRWATNSPEQPMLAGDNKALDVFNGTASFAYDGKWAFVKMLKDQAAPPSDFAKLRDDMPQTLRFDIPLTNVLGGTASPCPDTAKLFVRFKVKPIEESKDKKTGAVHLKAGPVVKLPNFPSRAPRLSGV